eukprot:m.35301 g.35301  ORF g.35301 m.35301 type:complete len:544 (-) comp10911_c0_seq2:62-1693(-)
MDTLWYAVLICLVLGPSLLHELVVPRRAVASSQLVGTSSLSYNGYSGHRGIDENSQVGRIALEQNAQDDHQGSRVHDNDYEDDDHEDDDHEDDDDNENDDHEDDDDDDDNHGNGNDNSNHNNNGKDSKLDAEVNDVTQGKTKPDDNKQHKNSSSTGTLKLGGPFSSAELEHWRRRIKPAMTVCRPSDPKTRLPSFALGTQSRTSKEASDTTPRRNVNVYLWANPRLASLFRSCRLATRSMRFTYTVFDPRHQLRGDRPDIFLKLMINASALNVLVYDGCCVPGWLLLHFPLRSVLVISADESARWGFSERKHFWGPHGPGELLKTDNQGVISLPENVGPLFKQYYSKRHSDIFKGRIRYMPLGSREEIQVIPEHIRPANKRKHLFNLVVAPTDPRRRYLHELLRNNTAFGSLGFVHVTSHWDANPNNAATDYLNSSEFRSVLLDSQYTLCPKGHSVEQFRIYEAIEAGSIPVVERDGQYAVEHLPPAYFSSPIVFVETWDDLPALLPTLDPKQRQIDLMQWYERYMADKVGELEALLLATENT